MVTKPEFLLPRKTYKLHWQLYLSQFWALAWLFKYYCVKPAALACKSKGLNWPFFHFSGGLLLLQHGYCRYPAMMQSGRNTAYPISFCSQSQHFSSRSFIAFLIFLVLLSECSFGNVIVVSPQDISISASLFSQTVSSSIAAKLARCIHLLNPVKMAAKKSLRKCDVTPP